MFENSREFENGANLSEVLSYLARQATADSQAYDEIKLFHAPRECFDLCAKHTAQEIAEYLREVGVTLREIEIEAELRTSPHYVYHTLDCIGYAQSVLLDYGHNSEAGFDPWGGWIDLEGDPVDQLFLGVVGEKEIEPVKGTLFFSYPQEEK